MIFKVSLKNGTKYEFQNILSAYTADNDETGEKFLTVITKINAQCYPMQDVKDIEVIGCGNYG